jgi:apolipoprotein D and lipocalin family protein
LCLTFYKNKEICVTFGPYSTPTIIKVKNFEIIKEQNMIKLLKKSIQLLSLATLFFTQNLIANENFPETVSHVELDRYLGTWYQIGLFPNSFQKKCLATQANYALKKNGKIAVTNSCFTKEGKINVANGIASVADKETNSKLKVGFAPIFKNLGLFTGDYWILELESDYQYVLVGSPSREFLWILSRTPTLEKINIDYLLDKAAEQGFDITRFAFTPTWPEER